jgi:hypothetical protein
MNKVERKYYTGEYVTVSIINVEVAETKVIWKEESPLASYTQKLVLFLKEQWHQRQPFRW